MAIEIKAPTFPESVADGTVATWHKKPGEAVKRDELIVDIETDKVVMEVLAEAATEHEARALEGHGVVLRGLVHVDPPLVRRADVLDRDRLLSTSTGRGDRREDDGESGEVLHMKAPWGL